MQMTFQDLISPMDEKDFFQNYFGKKYLHIKADEASSKKRSALFGWEDLNAILNMALAWSSTNFHVVLDKKMIPAREFCYKQLDRNQQEAWVPDQAKVMEWLNRGASIVMDDMDGLAVGSRAISGIFQEAFSAKVQANLYCSWKQRQAFDVHFDPHDVFAMHFAGEKIWNIYENRLDNPIKHENFQFTQAEHAKNCGAIKEQITMRPGDLLYIPKGQFHDALASDDTALHIAFGIHGYLGLDFVKDLSSALVADEIFRVPLPLPREGDEALKKHISLIAKKISSIAESKEVLEQIRLAQTAFRFPHHDFHLPLDVKKIESKGDVNYSVSSPEYKTDEQQGVRLLAFGNKATPMPDEFADAIEWVIKEQQFSDTALMNKFFPDNQAKSNKLIQDLINMGVIKKDEEN